MTNGPLLRLQRRVSRLLPGAIVAAALVVAVLAGQGLVPASAQEPGFAYTPDAAIAGRVTARWPGTRALAAGYIEPRQSRHRLRIRDVLLIGSAQSGWSIPAMESYVATLVEAFDGCGIGLAPTPLVLLERFPGIAEGEVDDTTWETQTRLAERMSGVATYAVMFADRIRSPYAHASIGGFAVYYQPLRHVIIARHNRYGEEFDPELTLPHEFAHFWLGKAHDPPGAPETIMAAQSCTDCRFSPSQCVQLRNAVRNQS